MHTNRPIQGGVTHDFPSPAGYQPSPAASLVYNIIDAEILVTPTLTSDELARTEYLTVEVTDGIGGTQTAHFTTGQYGNTVTLAIANATGSNKPLSLIHTWQVRVQSDWTAAARSNQLLQLARNIVLDVPTQALTNSGFTFNTASIYL